MSWGPPSKYYPVYAFYVTDVVWAPEENFTYIRPTTFPLIAAYDRGSVVDHLRNRYDGDIISCTIVQGEEL